MSLFSWLLWFLLGVGAGIVILGLSSNQLLGVGGSIFIFTLFLILGGMDYIGSRVNRKNLKFR